MPKAGVGPLVNVAMPTDGTDIEVGSLAFYKSLTWTLHGRRLQSLFAFAPLAAAYLAMPFRAKATMTLESASIPVWQVFQ
jgi:hypothetical protein